jgi:hypothetical protein
MKRTLGRAFCALIVLLFWTCCGSTPVENDDDGEGLRLLFIGNSLTYTHNLPGLLRNMLKQAEVDVGRMESIGIPNYGLQDHWVQGPARRVIAEDAWDIVVLQQGPSATEGRPSLLEYSERFAEEIEAVGARPALYMVWPASTRSFDFAGVSDAYSTAAERVDGLLFPAGEAWQAAWRQDTTLPLYGPDGFHPSLLGTYLAALVMFEQITGRDLHDLPAVIPTTDGDVTLTPQRARLLQDAALEANAAFALGTFPDGGKR